MKLLIAIPALNEEKSIEGIIERSLAARGRIVANSPVEEVEITVISDGSTDSTAEKAARYGDRIKLIVFPANRGYGAAIKQAWSESDADLLGFLDADGTCDPEFFAPLCRVLCDKRADVVIGCRMNRQSKMPWIRRVGNLLFASMLRLLSSREVKDTASGMRVVRRSSLPRIFPLPDGLQFTPAMSARALLDRELNIVEIEMPYEERTGRSKLRVGKDGLRFLKVILETALLYRPARPLAALGLLCAGTACGLMLMPTAYYLQHRSVAEWMIYRFVVSELAGATAMLFLSAAYLCHRILGITLVSAAVKRSPVERFFGSPWFWAVPAAGMSAGTALVIPSFLELVRTGATYEHWSRFIAMSSLFMASLILVVTWVINYVLRLLGGRLAYLASQHAGGRIDRVPGLEHEVGI